jgi:hypothetical protein
MNSSFRSRLVSPLIPAVLASAAVGGQYVASKAARDAIFLANFEAASLPAMVIASAIFSIVLVAASNRMLRGISPASWVPAVFFGMAVLVLADWALAVFAPGLAARLLYLAVSGAGPLLGSGFWLIASERFDPHTAKKVFGQIAGAGTLGGLLGGLGAAWVPVIADVGAMLPWLAALSLAGAWLIRRLATSPGLAGGHGPVLSAPASSGLRLLAEAPHLRDLAALVLLGTIAAAFVDQAFKTQIKTTLGDGSSLGSFFSLYYAALSLITFAVQTGGSRYVLEKLGLATATSTPALTCLVGGTGALVMPGFNSLLAMDAGEAVSRASTYRAGYELFYTPMTPHDKRAVKAIIDVGVDRTGDIVGAGITRQLLWIPQPSQTTVLVSLAMACAAAAVLVARRLTRGYVQALEEGLLARRVELDLSDIDDLTTRTIVMRTLQKTQAAIADRTPEGEARQPPSIAGAGVADLETIAALHSKDREAVRRVLQSDKGPSAAVVPHVIPLLASDDVSQYCIHALRLVAEERVGELTDALVDPSQPFVIRRRLARAFSACTSQRAADALLIGLDDLRFEVRYRIAQSLLAIVEKNPAIRIDQARIFAIVNREVTVSKQVWENRRLLDASDDCDQASFLEELVRARASQGLAHVFTLLALVLPTEPLRIAFRALHTDDPVLRGTALEYLEGVLPREIRDRLWPFIEGRRLQSEVRRPHEDTLAALLRSDESIKVRLEELKKRAAAARGHL